MAKESELYIFSDGPKSDDDKQKVIKIRKYLNSISGFKQYVNIMTESENFNAKTIWKSEKLREIMTNPKDYPNFPFWRIINLEAWSQAYEIENL